MKTHKRTIRVWLILVVAMVLTTGVLHLLQTEKVSSTQFSLTSYYVNSASALDVLRISSSATPIKWRGISVEFSNTDAGNISTLTMAKDLSSSDFLNYHFVVCNDYTDTADDGLIQPTARWENQFPCTEEGSWQSPGIVRICVIGKRDMTDKQRRSILNLVEGISRNCQIPSDAVVYHMGR